MEILMRKIILLLFLINFNVLGVNLEKNPIYGKIIKNKPSINKKYAMKLSNIIYKMSRKYKGDPILAVAIATQETGLKNKHRKQNVLQFFNKCNEKKCVEKWKVVRGISDVCMFQFHVNTIINYNIDPIKLKNNIEYCVEWHFKLMNIKKKLCKNMDKPWGCYHSRNKRLQNIYINFVERYL